MAKSTRTTKKPATSDETVTAPRPSARPRTGRPPESTTKPEITINGIERDAIARRAYELFQARGGEHGYEIEDWLQAERELTGRQDTR